MLRINDLMDEAGLSETFKYSASLLSLGDWQMAEVVVKVPEELKEFESVSPINWQLIVEKRLKEEFAELARLKRIVSKSKLTEKDVEELSEEVGTALTKRLLKPKE